MKFTKNQLDLFYKLITNTKSFDIFWALMIGREFDFGYTINSVDCWDKGELQKTTKERNALISVLRQLADVIEANQPVLDTTNEDNLPKAKK